MQFQHILTQHTCYFLELSIGSRKSTNKPSIETNMKQIQVENMLE